MKRGRSEAHELTFSKYADSLDRTADTELPTSNDILSRWNFTEVYRRTGGRWKIVQSHASYTLGRPPETR
jgi:hypothetical protein